MGAVTIHTIANGALAERFDDALKEVLVNIQDPNTDATATRSVTFVVSIKPDKSRELAAVSIDFRIKKAPPRRVKIVFFMGLEEGRAIAHEHDLKQPALFDEKPILREVKRV